MSLGGDDRTKHDINSPMRGSGNRTPSSKGFTINDASTTICINSPPMIIVALFNCSGTIIGKVWISGFGLRMPEGVVWDAREVLRKTRCLISVGVGRSDGCHKADPSFHAITKAPRILEALTVLVMGINKGVNDAHHHDSILEASQEHMGDQVM